MAPSFSGTAGAGPIFQIMKINYLLFWDFQLVGSESLGMSVCECLVVVSFPAQSGHMILWSGGRDRFAKSPTAPRASPSAASEPTALVIEVTCSSARIIVPLMPAPAVHHLFFKLNLLGWHWLIKLYRFQVYNSIIHHLYIVLCVHPPQVKSPSIPISTPFTLLYLPPIPFPSGNHHTVSVSMSFWFLISLDLFTFFTHPPTPHPSPDSCQPVLWVYESWRTKQQKASFQPHI